MPENKRVYKSDLERIDNMTDEDIDYSDCPELDEEFWKHAKLVHYQPPKKAVFIRLDEDVIQWFKTQGKGYQSRMNAVLKAYVQSRNATAT